MYRNVHSFHKRAVFAVFLNIFHVSLAFSSSVDLSFLEKALINFNINNENRLPKLGNFYLLKAIKHAQINKKNKTLGKSYKFLADSFYSGDGIDQSESLAIHYYKLSAKHKYSPAYFNLAVIFKSKKQYKQAIYYINQYIQHPNAELKNEAQTFKKSLELIN